MTDVLKQKLNEMTELLGITLSDQQYATAIRKLTGGVNASTDRISKIEAAMAGPPHIRGALQFALGECRRHNLKLTEELAGDLDALNAAMSDKKIPTDARFRIKSSLAACGLID
jgi:hypothetical protein